MTAPQSDAALRGRIGAHARWARTPDRVAALAPARNGFLRRFEREVDPNGELHPIERARLAESAMRAHMAKLALQRNATRRNARPRP